MHLPEIEGLPIKLLAACFNNTSATYKYYWFLSILQALETGNSSILKRELFSRMISNAWFTVNYFHISFGKQDQLQSAIELVKDFEKLMIDDDQERIYHTLIETKNKQSIRQLQYFNNQVPHWFLSPWFPKSTRPNIYLKSQLFKEDCIYALYKDEIIINPKWYTYLLTNARVLKDYCYWNLAMYLQSRNPNVPDIPNKLIKQANRGSLSKQRTQFWDVVIREMGAVKCIYTGKNLTVGNYAVEHFIPYQFVSHDLIWNLIPADQTFNSIKSDKLPPLDKYFNPFFSMQKQAIDIIREKSPKNKFLEDYLTIFSDLDELKTLPEYFTNEKFKERIQPLITIASNNGFEYLK